MKRLVWVFCVIVLGCSEDNIQNNEKPVVDSLATLVIEEEIPGQARNDESVFLEFYNQFKSDLGKSISEGINNVVHPNHGVYLISSDGAMPRMTKRDKQYRQKCIVGSPLMEFELNLDALKKEPVFESLPKVICDKEIYDKQGCFAEEINPILESQIWNYTDLNEKEVQTVEILAKTVNMTVIDTSNFTLYFSKIEGTWYLTFIDLRVPCQA